MQNRQLPLLWSSNNRPHSEFARSKYGESGLATPKNDEEFGDINLIDDNAELEHNHRVYLSKLHNHRVREKTRLKRRRLYRINRCASAALRKEPNPTRITMIYYGKGIKLPFDTQVFESKDQIDVYQQHCGGENLVVFSGLLEANQKFDFISKRHKEYPFSLTLYINGTYDCRISTCCEYRHGLNKRIGGKTGRFGFTDVSGNNPCVKCLLEKDRPPIKPPSYPTRNRSADDINIYTDKNKRPVSSSKDKESNRREIALKDSKSDVKDEYTSDFVQTGRESSDSSDESTKLQPVENWSVLVRTKSRRDVKQLKANQTSQVFIKIKGTKRASDNMLLGQFRSDNFRTSDTLNLKTNSIGTPTQVFITHEDKNDCIDWQIDHVTLVDTKSNKKYSFKLANDQKIVRNKPIELHLDCEFLLIFF